MNSALGQAVTAAEPRLEKRSIAVAALSTVVEWYDFTLYLYFSTVLSRVFFGPGAASLVAALGGFAVAYLMRPVGAVVFGHIGDRRGRRPMLLLSMAVMSVAMLATALLPTEAQIGPLAAWLLILLRCVMGFSVGGEYTGVVAYLLESAPAGRRGLVASLAAAASEVGALLAVGVSALTVSAMSNADSGDLGLADPVPGRRRARRSGLAGAFDDEEIAGFRTAAGEGHRSAQSAPPRALAAAPGGHLRLSRSRPWARSLIMSGSPTSRPSSPRPARRARRNRCGFPPSPPSPSSSSPLWSGCSPTGWDESRCCLRSRRSAPFCRS